MTINRITPEQLWSRQQINLPDVDYDLWEKERLSIMEFAELSRSCLFTVDVFKGRYDYASDWFSHYFGYDLSKIRSIREQGDLLEERIHPADRAQLVEYQIEHAGFIYSLPPEERNRYRQVFQMRVLNAAGEYVNVVSRHQVLREDKSGKAWIILGIMDIAPDQSFTGRVKRSVIDRETGEIVISELTADERRLSGREREVLMLIRQGMLSKEIAARLGVSIYTVNNHRKNILAKLGVGNIIEAINTARDLGMLF